MNRDLYLNSILKSVIVANVNQFRYFLRFDENREEAFAEGLINNATKLSKTEVDLLIGSFKFEWSVKVIPYE